MATIGLIRGDARGRQGGDCTDADGYGGDNDRSDNEDSSRIELGTAPYVTYIFCLLKNFVT